MIPIPQASRAKQSFPYTPYTMSLDTISC
ncbi:Protein of unknown function [Pyronema omphalodes CBS 100304]|uniref:Uncharacterized protein n=1 Tax=Pyronema omphalodes (strain CBS 100304) TaxID=1076935 RepID=U4LMD5_PYROM|nr:Protein of unknown function [Pyronema omphalodes CBS 100304]